MTPIKKHTIDGIEYFETKLVTLKGTEYQELRSTNPIKPSVLYAEIIDGNLSPITDDDIGYALMVKYAMCILSLHGYPVMDRTLTLNEDEFEVRNGKLLILNEEKRAIFDRYIKKENN